MNELVCARSKRLSAFNRRQSYYDQPRNSRTTMAFYCILQTHSSECNDCIALLLQRIATSSSFVHTIVRRDYSKNWYPVLFISYVVVSFYFEYDLFMLELFLCHTIPLLCLSIKDVHFFISWTLLYTISTGCSNNGIWSCCHQTDKTNLNIDTNSCGYISLKF